jgi:hypothetical protein
MAWEEWLDMHPEDKDDDWMKADWDNTPVLIRIQKD